MSQNPLPRDDAWKAQRTKELVAELARRRAEGLNVYQPLQLQQEFHACKTPERLLRGGHRTGKTLSAAVEIARAVLGRDPFNKYPKRDGVAILVAKDGKAVSQVLFNKLFRSGESFKMIRDLETGLWRAFRPWEEESREHEAKWAPPLIPNRYIYGGWGGIAWENKKTSQPVMIKLTTGWELHFFTSLGKPPRGWAVDLVWFDEEVEDGDWYPEMAGRLFDRAGKFIWSATPQAGTQHLLDLHFRAEDDSYKPPEARIISEFHLTLDDNLHQSKEKKQLFLAKLDQEQARVRYYGDYAGDRYRVYPEYNKFEHVSEYFPIPADWCRYMVLDPGRQICAALFAAVPPPGHKLDGHVFLYDELYIQECSAERFGHALNDKIGSDAFHAFIIDYRGGRVTDTGSGRNIEVQYSDQLKKYGIKSAVTGFGFISGNDDVEAGISSFRSWMFNLPDSKPKLQVFAEKMPNFVEEIKNYRYARVKFKDREYVSDKPIQKRNHLVDCCRYLAMYSPEWHEPQKRKKLPSAVSRRRQEKLRLKRKHEGATDHVHLGPGTG